MSFMLTKLNPNLKDQISSKKIIEKKYVWQPIVDAVWWPVHWALYRKIKLYVNQFV